MTGTPGAASPGWYPTDHGWRWWDGYAWGLLAPPPLPEEEAGKTVAIFSTSASCSVASSCRS
jgi:hypothetical protein